MGLGLLGNLSGPVGRAEEEEGIVAGPSFVAAAGPPFSPLLLRVVRTTARIVTKSAIVTRAPLTA